MKSLHAIAHAAGPAAVLAVMLYMSAAVAPAAGTVVAAETAAGSTANACLAAAAPDRVAALADIRPELALPLCRAAAAHSPADPRLAHALARANARAGNTGQAMAAYQRAATQGDAAAQHELARLLLAGGGAAAEAQAVTWLQMAAAAGAADAGLMLGVLHRTGRGVPADDRLAARWLALALARGDRRVADQARSALAAIAWPERLAAGHDLLRAAGYDPGLLSDDKSPVLVAAIRRFQSDAGIASDGLLTEALLAALADHVAPPS